MTEPQQPRLTSEQLDELERRVANWMEADDDFDADVLVVDAVLTLLPLAIAELRAARAT